ncbi:hypothetical protein [Qipengyuania spongiae]|uniref:Uncharacterized protein n=1 Tax=Qipengyuania spongiae TaxID=2909673 RepID=A0ABY5SZ57_9SPHN|nr:hypothetical protein [Qipengyuania spongiae]UVI39146.1 hypothetical protein L1F33_13075 [Qipengyuania spongiae]
MDEADVAEATFETPFGRSYDFFKHTTGISLVSLGGVFAFADGQETEFDPPQLIVVLTFIGLAGVTSLLMASHLASIEVKPHPRAKVARAIRIAQALVSALLSGGVGAFMYNFTPAILK